MYHYLLHGVKFYLVLFLVPYIFIIHAHISFRYRTASEQDEVTATSPKKTKAESSKPAKTTSRRRVDELWNGK